MFNNIAIKSVTPALVSAFIIASGCAMAEPPEGNGGEGGIEKVDYQAMSSEELADYLIFEAKSFDLDQKTQEGGTVRDRLRQDKIQKACSGSGKVDSATSEKVRRIAKENMEYPEEGIELGDWEEGKALSQNAYGYRVAHKVDDHTKRNPGGLCMNCHQINPAAKDRSGTIGPSLIGYGKKRGTGEAIKKYTYEVIYNPHVAFPCTGMPRFGANGFLNEEQIADLMAYLLDPDSPVNQ